jgi:hypothetical protein
MPVLAASRELYRSCVLLISACAALCVLALTVDAAHGATIAEPTTGISITVLRDGTYTIQSLNPQWTFSGIVAGGVKNIRVDHGADAAGDYQQISFEEHADAARHFGIRTWSGRPGILFTQVLPEAHANPPAFPRFSTHPNLPYNLSYGGTWFRARFDLGGTEGPWVQFDDAAETAVLSPAANFMVAKLRVGPAGEFESGIDGAIATLPKGQGHATLLVLDHGINRAFDTWGRILTDIQGKVRPANDADATLKYLGYWTDNGAAYYYTFDPSKGYEGTLLGVRDDFAEMGLPLGYMQLDSWWYRKGESGDWNPKPDQWNFGISTYEAHPEIFPDGLASFRERLGLPLVTHARWIDQKSPYRAKYTISNNVAVDPQYWKDIAAYLKSSGVTTYEQDWLDSRATADFNLADQEAFMDDMASALAANGITMQYCMPTPRHVLQGSKYSNLTSIRLSDDHFERGFWPQMLYASRLASALGIWPWVDVCSSGETANLMIATLSGGVVGASDAIGSADVRNLRRAARPDGVLVKPDAPLVPTDSTFLAEARNGAGPMVAYTYTDHQAGRAVYVVALRRGDATNVVFNPSETGLGGSVYAYDVRGRAGTIVNASLPMTLDLSQDWSGFVFVPISRCGIAIVGDLGKFVPRGRARIRTIVDREQAVDVEVSFAADEKRVTLTGYSTGSPEISAATGRIISVSWDSASGLFDVILAPGSEGSARITLTSAAPTYRRRSA